MANYGPDWQLWIWIAVVGLLLLAAVSIAASGRSRLPVLPPQHIAAATLIGLLTWGLVQQLPSIYFTVSGTYAGIEQAPSKGLHQAFVALHGVVTIGGVLAVFGLLWRQAWAVVLGLAVCAASIGTSIIAIGNFFSAMDGFDGIAPEFSWFAVSVVLQPIPAIAGVALLVWPFLRPPDRSRRVEPDRNRGRDDGVVDADPEEAAGVAWPDRSAPASDQR